MKRFVLGALAMALAMAAQADTYIGGAIGASKVDINCYASCDDGDMGFKIYGGIGTPISGLPSLALEVGYIDFGKAVDSFGVGGFAGSYHDIEVSAFTFDAALRAKFTPALSGVGRLGLAYVDGTSTVGGSILAFGGSASESASELKLHFGVGLEYAISKQLKLTGSADFTSYETGHTSGDAHLFSLGLQYGF
jgi:hypothetical protein